MPLITLNTDLPVVANIDNVIACVYKVTGTDYQYDNILLPSLSDSGAQEIKNLSSKKIHDFLKTYELDQRLGAINEQIGQHALISKLNKILKAVYATNPKSFAIQLTGDGSILFSFTKSEKKGYLEFFPENATLGIEEFVLNIYGNNGTEDIIDNFSAPLTKVLTVIEKTINESTLSEIKSLNVLQPNLNVGLFSNYFTTSAELQVY